MFCSCCSSISLLWTKRFSLSFISFTRNSLVNFLLLCMWFLTSFLSQTKPVLNSNDFRPRMPLTIIFSATTEIPSPPSALTVLNVTSNSVNLTWSEPFDGHSMISKYLVRLSDPLTNETIVESESFVVSRGHRNALITRLTPFTEYRSQVFAQNEVGWSTGSAILDFKTQEASPDSPPIDVTAKAIDATTVLVEWKVSC